jgi:hypothetical protein
MLPLQSLLNPIVDTPSSLLGLPTVRSPAEDSENVREQLDLASVQKVLDLAVVYFLVNILTLDSTHQTHLDNPHLVKPLGSNTMLKLTAKQPWNALFFILQIHLSNIQKQAQIAKSDICSP